MRETLPEQAADGNPAALLPPGDSDAALIRDGLEGQVVCPFCGVVGDGSQNICPKCTMENTAVARKATKLRIGPWYVLQNRNPAAPGMKWETLLSFVRKGRVKPQSIVRGPSTHQLWRFAAHVKGLSREFGVCYSCGGSVEREANLCPHCNRLQDTPSNPDTLLEGAESEARLPIYKEIASPEPDQEPAETTAPDVLQAEIEKQQALAEREDTIAREQRDAIERERQAAVLEREAAERERKALEQERQAAERERELFRREQEAIVRERDAVFREKALIEKDRDVLATEREAIGKEREAAMAASREAAAARESAVKESALMREAALRESATAREAAMVREAAAAREAAVAREAAIAREVAAVREAAVKEAALQQAAAARNAAERDSASARDEVADATPTAVPTPSTAPTPTAAATSSPAPTASGISTPPTTQISPEAALNDTAVWDIGDADATRYQGHASIRGSRPAPQGVGGPRAPRARDAFLSPKDLAAAFKLNLAPTGDYDIAAKHSEAIPDPTPAVPSMFSMNDLPQPPRRGKGKMVVVIGIIVVVIAALAISPDLRQTVLGLVGLSSEKIPAPKGKVIAPKDDLPDVTPPDEPVVIPPPAHPSTPAAVATQPSSNKPSTPDKVPTPDPAPAAPSPAALAATKVLCDQAKAAEVRADYAAAVKLWEQVHQQPKNTWPENTDVDFSLAMDKKLETPAGEKK